MVKAAGTPPREDNELECFAVCSDLFCAMTQRGAGSGSRSICLSHIQFKVHKTDNMLTMNVEKGLRHPKIHQQMRVWVLLRYGVEFDQSVALSIAWRRSKICFCKAMGPFVRAMRQQVYRTLDFVYAFLIILSTFGIILDQNIFSMASSWLDSSLK